MSISSDEGHTKVLQIQGGSSGKAGKKAVKKAKPSLSAEEKKDLKEKNGKVLKVCRKAIKELGPVVKSCNKLTNSQAADEPFKEQVWAAKELVKNARKLEAKSKAKTEEEFSFDSTEEGIKDLKKSLEAKEKAIRQVESMLAGGFDEEHLEKIKGMVKQKNDRRANAKDAD